MKPLLTLLTLVAAVAVSAATSLLLRPAGRPVHAITEADADELAHRCERLEASQAKLTRSVDELAGILAETRLANPREAVSEEGGLIDDSKIDQAVARWFASHAGAAEVTAVDPGHVESAQELLERLLDPSFGGLAKEELWQRLREEKRLDEVVTAFEEYAAAHPEDPGAQVELGAAYLEKIQEVGAGPLAGVWATKADQAFDRALQLDPEHWEGRFSKAVALSFWPPVFGKQSEAIHHFEILVEQQARRGNQNGFAQTHLLLGNLYQQIGEADKAMAAWEHGLSIFPDDHALLAQIELARAQ